MPESMIRVDRDRIIYGSILSFKIDDIETGATTGEVTVRRAVEYFDVTVEQVNGTIAKSVINDQRFLELTLAEANLPNIRRAWDDAGGVVVSQTYENYDASELLPRGLASDDLRIYMLGATGKGLYKLDNLGKATRVRASNAVVDPTDFGLTTAEALPHGLTFFGDQLYMVGETGAELYTVNHEDGTAAPLSSPAVTFGTVAELLPRGLASDGTTLWMVGATGKKLYTVVPSTGVGTAVRYGDELRCGSGRGSAWFSVGRHEPVYAWPDEQRFIPIRCNDRRGVPDRERVQFRCRRDDAERFNVVQQPVMDDRRSDEEVV